MGIVLTELLVHELRVLASMAVWSLHVGGFQIQYFKHCTVYPG